MSCNSGASISSNRVRVPGIPKKCHCESPIVQKISRSVPNPYRRYYRCAYAAQMKLENDNHVFKWLDEALVDEIEQLDFQVDVLEEEVRLMKMEKIQDMKELNKKMIIVFCSCVLVVCLVKWYN
ncbi:uncharacterized protein At4g04775-like [Arabidopsis lyrata subsp. lyrata]|uniref:uncharacterized protein At4g04775-like n=1 Tax=Arabidopsis lyrata subsp. lyrata TaxID=81972 RepID=UPI000A29EA05|nr:uncharacterized protein At4g04775-like [Arabidopsis lyrata subsp. lyrata]|eukprot:XP_020876125.1 uncharacterized protein At4g04775-like [Arabidopsis lyrata subsp. lyrata]